ncbi:MAG: hypothetical protein V4629_02960 [Pseudomonadota bacterium]
MNTFPETLTKENILEAIVCLASQPKPPAVWYSSCPDTGIVEYFDGDENEPFNIPGYVQT